MALSLLAAMSLASCGKNDGPDSASGDQREDTLDVIQFCSQVWVVGKTLPRDYPGCVERDGITFVQNSTISCTPIGEPIRPLDAESYDRRLIAELGGEITEDRERAQRLDDELNECKASVRN